MNKIIEYGCPVCGKMKIEFTPIIKSITNTDTTTQYQVRGVLCNHIVDILTGE